MIRAARIVGSACFLASFAIAASALAGPFTFDPPGVLVAGSGKGRVDTKVYSPGIRFPMETGPAFANSQVWGVGGSSGPSGSQCDARNFSYPWHDNFCETRSWTMPLCPSGTGHQGQDVRTLDCTPDVHWAVAVEDGTITSIGSYSVYLTAADGTRFDYLHMSGVAVKVGQKVKRGDHMGHVSNQFGTSTTTVHLHFNIQQNVSGVGAVFVPPYESLIQAYEVLMGISPGDSGPIVDVGVVDAKVDSIASDASASDGPVIVPVDGGGDTEPKPPSDGEIDPGTEDVGGDASSDGGAALSADVQGSAGCGCRAGSGSTKSAGGAIGVALVAAAIVRRRRARRARTTP